LDEPDAGGLGGAIWEGLRVELAVAPEIHRLAPQDEHAVAGAAGAHDLTEKLGIADPPLLDCTHGCFDCSGVEGGGYGGPVGGIGSSALSAPAS